MRPARTRRARTARRPPPPGDCASSADPHRPRCPRHDRCRRTQRRRTHDHHSRPHDGNQPDANRASRRDAEREAKRAAKRSKKAGTATGEEAATREAMRAGLIAQGFDPLVVEAMLPALAAPKHAYLVRQAVADAVTAMRRDLPRSEKTWGPYLQLLVDGLPDMCSCPCPACAVRPPLAHPPALVAEHVEDRLSG
jgi:hypothetical protein